MQCVICSIAKNENAYLYEWALYHLQLGFSHIYIYDNNDKNGEIIENVFQLCDFKDKISIIDVRGQKYVQKFVYNLCYTQMSFDWCAFIDIDEFITLENHKNIEDFLSLYNDWESIHLNWKCYGDSGQVSYTTKGVTERFKKAWNKNFKYGYKDIPENAHIKSIIKKGLNVNWEYDGDEWSSNPHTPYGLNKICNPLFEQVENEPFAPICHQVAFIRHYITKTIEEYAIKVSRQCADCAATFYSFQKFFRINNITLKKIIWLRRAYPTISICDCIKEHVKYSIVNYNLPFQFLFRSLKK